jgi:nucleolin
VQLDRNTGKSRGFGYVTFATTEAADAAMALNGTKEIDGRTLRLDKSADVGSNREKRAQAFGDVPSAPSKVLFVGNLSWNTVEDTLWDAFSEYGEVSSVRLPTDRESGKPKGYGYIEFSVVDSAQKAFDAMSGQELDGRQIRLDFSQPRDANGAGRGRGAGFDGGRGRGGFGGGRGRGGFDGGRGRGGFDGGRGRGGGRVRRFTLFEILRPDNLFCHRVVVAIAAAAGVEPEAECETAPLLPLKVTRSLSNIVPRFRPYLQFPRHNIFRP